MRVDSYRIREMRAIQPLPREFGGEDGGTAPGSVDVQPEVLLAADLRDGADGVVASQHGRARRRVDVKGGFALAPGAGDEGFEGGRAHAAGGAVDGDGPYGRGAEAEHLRGFFDAVVAVGAGEEDEGAVGIAIFLGGGEEGVAGDDDGGGVGGGAALDGDPACVGTREAEERGEGAGGCFFDDGEGGGGVVDVDVGVEDREDQVRGYAWSVGGGVEFCQEPLVPCVDGVLEDFLGQLQEAFLTDACFGELGIEELGELLRFMLFDEGSPRCTSSGGQAVACVFDGGIFVCCTDEWNEKVLHGTQKLRRSVLRPCAARTA